MVFVVRWVTTRLPVRSALIKQCTSRLAKWMTSGESPLLYVSTALHNIARRRRNNELRRTIRQWTACHYKSSTESCVLQNDTRATRTFLFRNEGLTIFRRVIVYHLRLLPRAMPARSWREVVESITFHDLEIMSAEPGRKYPTRLKHFVFQDTEITY